MTQAKWLLQAAAGVALALVVPLTVLGAEDKERGVGDVVYVPRTFVADLDVAMDHFNKWLQAPYYGSNAATYIRAFTKPLPK